jgi:two-component system cell cycle sensor histidine kinase/response regulator CckA
VIQRTVVDRAPLATRAFGRWTPVLVTVVGLVLSALVIFYIRREEARGRQREFERRASNTALRVEDYLRRREEALYALRNLFEYSTNVTRQEFEGFARDLRSRQVGIHALEWVPLVPAAERAQVEATMRADGFPNFEFKERAETFQEVRRAADRPLYAPILYLEPLAGNEPAHGYDVGSDRTAWPRLLQCAASGTLLSSGRLPLLVPPGGGPSWGYIVELPVYHQPASTLSPEERVPQLRGFILSVFQVNDVLEEMFRRMGGIGLDVLFLDRTAPPERQFLHYHPAAPEPPGTTAPTETEFAGGMHTIIKSDRAGRQWELWFRPSAAWRATFPSYRSWFFGSLFVGISLGLGVYLRSQQRRALEIERLVAERTAELTESQRTLDAFLHALPGMAYRGTYEDEFDITFVSEGSLALTGYRPEEFLSRRMHLRQIIHPEDLPRARQATRDALRDGREVEVEYRLRTRDGTEKWVLSRGRNLGNDAQGRRFFEGLAIDITAQKKAEHERLGLERKLLEGQKLESLGLLAGGIAHDFNNLLSSILGNASMGRLALPAGNPIDPQLRAIETASLRAAELCRQMLAYAGKGRFVVEPVDLTALADELLPLLRISTSRHATLDLRLERQLPPVMADATQLRQIVMNLVLNAADALGERGGEITLTTGRMHVDAAALAACATGGGLPEGDYVFLEVRDTGCGMTAEVMAKIFDPFFTTKFAGRGLGLAAVLGIVRGHHGALHVASTPNAGSLFRLLLPPAAGATVAPKSAEPAKARRWTHPGTVLVIEDEEQVRNVTVQILKTFTLQVQDAANGTEGAAVFRANAGRFDLVVLDMLMPGLNGEQTLAALRAIKPDVRVLLVSGYSEGDVLRRLAGAGPLAFLPKPFTRDGLEQKLRELLG